MHCNGVTSSLIQIGHTFWWQPTTTKAPETIIKHVPLTYFRTYTYQPLASNPFSYPFLGGAGGAASYGAPPIVAQSPLLAGPRYETYNGAGNGIGYMPPTTSTTTTSTTTTTRAPPPPPPPTTTTSTTTTTPAPPPTTMNSFSQGVPYSADYPTYNRRFYNTGGYNQPNYYRPSYPYPEYSTVNLAALKLASTMGERLSPNIQFVPCMCPISVDVVNGLDRKNGMSSLFAETRAGSEEDDDLDIPLEKTKLVIEKDMETEKSGEENAVELQPTNKIDLANNNDKISNEQLPTVAEEDKSRI